jgi:hypothetical protein
MLVSHSNQLAPVPTFPLKPPPTTMSSTKQNSPLRLCSLLVHQHSRAILQQQGRVDNRQKEEEWEALASATSSGPPSLEYVSTILKKGIDLVDKSTTSRRGGISQFDGPEAGSRKIIVDMDIVVPLHQQEHNTAPRSRISFSESQQLSSSNDGTSSAEDDNSTSTVDSTLVYKRRRRLAKKRAAANKRSTPQ